MTSPSNNALRFSFKLVLGLLLIQPGAAWTQPSGSIIGWGKQVVPEPSALQDLVAVSAGRSHSLGLNGDGGIVAWGWNDYSQCTVPAPNSDFMAVASGSDHSLGLKVNGSVVAWGWNQYGQLNVPMPNAGFVAIAGGAEHSLGLKADSSIVAWGGYSFGQRDDLPPTVGSFRVVVLA